ncbi:ATP12 family chaperone protein [Pacificimonas sp. ICDLI1SI03]
MRRFYKQAAAIAGEGGYAVNLDGRPLKTPKRNDLILPTQAMADAVVAEWAGQGDVIDPVSMPVTGLANAAIDHVAADRRTFVAGIAAYGESDLLCYRATNPEPLVERQCAVWNPLVEWAGRRYDIALTLVDGIMHEAQPDMTLQRLAAALDGFDDFALAAAQPLTTISGSLIVTLALLEGEIDVETAWNAGHLDELWQVEQWGEDQEAAVMRAHRRQAFEHAATFLTLR